MPGTASFDFTGLATRFSQEAIEDAAEQIGCDVAAIKAVIDVESRGGFLTDKRPKILFERHIFSRLTKGKHDAGNDDISSKNRRGYVGGAGEYPRLERAMQLDRGAALQSASWGAFQIMGENYRSAGYSDVESFCRDMCESEDKQLGAFVGFVRNNKLDDELCRRDWTGFARGYNGPAFRENRYDEKLAAAYTLHALSPPRADPVERTLRMGDRGDDVEWLQGRLGVAADGDFGPATKRAVIDFQQAHGLDADGVVGRRTLTALKS